MTRMKKPRITITVNAPQLEFLERFSESRGMSVADFCRWIFDNYREEIGQLQDTGVKL